MPPPPSTCEPLPVRVVSVRVTVPRLLLMPFSAAFSMVSPEMAATTLNISRPPLTAMVLGPGPVMVRDRLMLRVVVKVMGELGGHVRPDWKVMESPEPAAPTSYG